MMPYKSTQQVADQLGITESVAHDAVRRRLIPPVVVVGHSRLWKDADIEALRTVIERRRCPRPRLSSTGRPDGGLGVQEPSTGSARGGQS